MEAEEGGEIQPGPNHQLVPNALSDAIAEWTASNYAIAWRDISVTATECNRVTQNKDSPFTKLAGISCDGTLINTLSITSEHLRKMTIRLRIHGARTKTKKLLADGLVEYRGRMERADLTGEEPLIDDRGDPIRFFDKRYINVLFSTIIRPLL